MTSTSKAAIDISLIADGYAKAQTGPVINFSLSVYSFFTEAVVSNRSLARVMPT